MNLFERLDRFETKYEDNLRCNFIGTTAAIIGGIAMAGSSIASGVMAKKGADSQANAVQKASDEAVAEQRRQYDLTRSDYAPWRDVGGKAINTLGYYAGVTGDPNAPPSGSSTSDYGSLLKDFSLADFQTDPGYEFRLGEGAKALERSAAAKGQLFSGGTLKDLTQYNQNFASNEFGNAYNRFNTNKLNRYNILAGISQGGVQATNGTAQAGTTAANNISNTLMSTGEQVGNARASGYSAIGQTINGVANAGLSAYLASQKPSAQTRIGIYS
jgi:hypothetical protein